MPETSVGLEIQVNKPSSTTLSCPKHLHKDLKGEVSSEILLFLGAPHQSRSVCSQLTLGGASNMCWWINPASKTKLPPWEEQQIPPSLPPGGQS